MRSLFYLTNNVCYFPPQLRKSIEMKFFRRKAVHPFLTTKAWINFGREGRRTRWGETKNIQIKLAATCNKNEQQQGAKNNAELYTKWTKTTWKTFEETIRRCRCGSIKANWWRMKLMMMMMTRTSRRYFHTRVCGQAPSHLRFIQYVSQQKVTDNTGQKKITTLYNVCNNFEQKGLRWQMKRLL